MLFNSFEFIFFFLPITLFIFVWVGQRGHHEIAITWLVLCSLFFYGWWNPSYLILILFSMIFNYFMGVVLGGHGKESSRKIFLIVGITTNLLLLGYFKYTNFFFEQLNNFVDTSFHFEAIVLPLAISFFTFQQIAYLVDAFRYETKEYNFLHYCLFVTFFPQLIAGPIVHHKEMLPQFSKGVIYKFDSEKLAIGLSIFIIGLFKKVVFADGMAIYATPVFSAAETQAALTFFEAWGGALAYTLQLYFDFSGYSDMAIGIAFMFGIKLPINFNSPYKSSSIIEFWRRWHITLSRFLRDYLYFALGGNKKGNVRRYINLLLTMLLGGLWHGAGWTFALWGLLHGVYLMVNHAWRKIRKNLIKWPDAVGIFEMSIVRILTFLAIVIGWVYFRAGTLETANHMLYTMFGGAGISLPASLQTLFGSQSEYFGFSFNGMFGDSKAEMGEGIIKIIFLLFCVFVIPNSLELVNKGKKLYEENNGKFWVEIVPVIISIAFFMGVSSLMSVSEFLYFNF